MNSWFITDNDTCQCCKVIDEDKGIYQFIQVDSYEAWDDPFYQVDNGKIYISDYQDDEILSTLNTYGYDNLQDFVEQVGQENSNRLIAEMFFESECQEYCKEEYDSFDKAKQNIETETGLKFLA